jgi:hypothetical protein
MNSETMTPQGDVLLHGNGRAASSNHEHTRCIATVSLATARIVSWGAVRRSTVENMSGVLQPVGPEPPIVYWVRRGTVLVIVLTVLIGGWWLLSSRSAATPGAAESAAAIEDATGEATGEVGPDGEPLAPIDEAVASPAEPTDCADSAIEVTASTDSSTYRVGQQDPVLTLTIENIGEVPCFRDIGPKANELEITSGGYHVWSSDDCATNDEPNVTLMAPGQQAVSSLTWNSRLSQKGCPDEGKGRKAKAGRYEVLGRNLDVTSDGTPFALSNKKN